MRDPDDRWFDALGWWFIATVFVAALLFSIGAHAGEAKKPKPPSGLIMEILTESAYTCPAVDFPRPLAAVCQSYRTAGIRYLICTERDGTAHEFIIEGRPL